MVPGEVIELKLDVVSKNKQGHLGLHYSGTLLQIRILCLYGAASNSRVDATEDVIFKA
jgi:hypothetical protein